MMTDFLPDIEACVDALARGGIILYPTDTVWGLGCDATNAEAVSKIYGLKQRTKTSLIVLLAEERQIIRYVTQLHPGITDYLKTVHKPTTVVYDGAVGIAGNIMADDGSVGIRVVRDAFCKHLIKRFRRPVVSTSANLSGQPAPGSFSEISKDIIQKVDYTVHYRQDDLRQSAPSAVVKWNADGTVTTLRT